MNQQSNFKFYTSACGIGHGNFIQPLGFEPTKNIEEADIIIFGGGADIDPNTYSEKSASSTYCSPGREKQEKEDFKIGRELGKKFLGICRGVQFLCAMAGGKLIQDVGGHGGTDHTMTTLDGNTIKVNSIHHQMINPYAIKNKHDYKILAWSTKRRSNRYLGAHDKSILLPHDFKEIEAIVFPKINGIGFQYHPEMMKYSGEYDAALGWTQTKFMKFFNGEL
jgi:gamma-glutamyl-gamma-aminobutyrate hydrolase PuuD